MSDLAITYLRTSSVLIEYDGHTLLTDPWFSMVMRFVPVFRAPGIAFNELPKLDLIVASHFHPDHFEVDSVRQLAHAGMEIVGARGAANVCKGMPVRAVHDMWHWESVTVGPFTMTATPAVHTGPPPLEVNFIIDAGPHRIFFGGDARWSDAYRQVSDRYTNIDIALLPIGGTLIFGHRTTMSPVDAVRACNYLRPKYAVPIHEGGEWMPVPPASWHPGRNRHFVRALEDSGLPVKPCVIAPGERVTFDSNGEKSRYPWPRAA
jgi:L-ascorbate metabolism protein UlaG (beta-lactamase superfamily)